MAGRAGGRLSARPACAQTNLSGYGTVYCAGGVKPVKPLMPFTRTRQSDPFEEIAWHPLE
jgi:hypothetical protein